MRSTTSSIDQTWDISGGGTIVNIREQDRSNEDFFNIPELSIDASVEYPIELNFLGLPELGTLTPLVHVYYQSDADTHFTAAGFASRAFPPGRLHAARPAPDLGPLGRSHAAALFANNVTGVKYFDSAIDLTNTLGMGGVYYSSPRMIGAELSYRWQ